LNAPDKFSQLMTLTREPLPASRKIYVPGQQPGVQVPMREIMQSNGEAVTVYDTSGPYTDPQATIDVRQGLAPLRHSWIEGRGDTESYTGRSPFALDDGLKNGETDALAALRAQAAGLQRTPRRAKAGANVTQMHYARKGIITPEMEYVAIRENQKQAWMEQYLGNAERERA
jgi:phosphomethylpyrimidine synthase